DVVRLSLHANPLLRHAGEESDAILISRAGDDDRSGSLDRARGVACQSAATGNVYAAHAQGIPARFSSCNASQLAIRKAGRVDREKLRARSAGYSVGLPAV